MTKIPLPSTASAEGPNFDFDRNDDMRQIVADIAYRKLAIVNVIFVGSENAGDGNWVLVDAGIPGSARGHSFRGERAFRRQRQARLHRHDAWSLRPCRRARGSCE